MAPTPLNALRAAHRPSPAHRRAVGARVLLAGAAGTLGAAVLEQLLASRAFVQVSVLVTQPLSAALPGLTTLRWLPPGTDDPPAGAPAPVQPHADSALVVFDRPRHANGREQAFLRPEPSQLPALAANLKARGVRRLLVVQPQASVLLPQALRQGLADLDEHAVARLGFEHLLFMRSARRADRAAAAHPLQRLADWALSQLTLMVPPREQPVRADKVARFAVQLAAQWAADPTAALPGTRVVSPEVVWDAAQSADIAGFARRWLAGQATPATPLPVPRL